MARYRPGVPKREKWVCPKCGYKAFDPKTERCSHCRYRD